VALSCLLRRLSDDSTYDVWQHVGDLLTSDVYIFGVCNVPLLCSSEDDTPVPKHVGIDTKHETYCMICIVMYCILWSAFFG
jgi:hypothetical protein